MRLPTAVVAVLATLPVWSIATGHGVARGEDVVCGLHAPGFDRGKSSAASCLVCHDGSAAEGIRLMHPVDVSYASAWLDRRADLNGIIPPELVLAHGRVTCATCHDGASPRRFSLAVPGAKLCTSCHWR